MLGQTATIDWTQIILQIVTTVGVIATAFIVRWNGQRIRLTNKRVDSINKKIDTPSGDSIGAIAERTHDIAHTNHAQLILHGDENRATAETTKVTAVQTEAQLKEIHGLVNDRLDEALRRIQELNAELLLLRKQRDELAG